MDNLPLSTGRTDGNGIRILRCRANTEYNRIVRDCRYIGTEDECVICRNFISHTNDIGIRTGRGAVSADGIEFPESPGISSVHFIAIAHSSRIPAARNIIDAKSGGNLSRRFILVPVSHCPGCRRLIGSSDSGCIFIGRRILVSHCRGIFCSRSIRITKSRCIFSCRVIGNPESRRIVIRRTLRTGRVGNPNGRRVSGIRFIRFADRRRRTLRRFIHNPDSDRLAIPCRLVRAADGHIVRLAASRRHITNPDSRRMLTRRIVIETERRRFFRLRIAVHAESRGIFFGGLHLITKCDRMLALRDGTVSDGKRVRPFRYGAHAERERISISSLRHILDLDLFRLCIDSHRVASDIRLRKHAIHRRHSQSAQHKGGQRHPKLF